MTEVRETFDPRYDARFQRGYEWQADAAERPVPQAEPALSVRPGEHSGVRPAPRPEAQVGAREPLVDDSAAALARRLGFTDAESPAPTPAAAAARRISDPTAPPASPASPEASGPPAEPEWEVSEPTRAPAPAARGVSRAAAIRWFWLVIAVSLVCIVGGAWVSWTANSDVSFYTGGTPEDWMGLQRLQAFALPLAQAGVVGLVGAVLAWALFAPAKPAIEPSATPEDGRP